MDPITHVSVNTAIFTAVTKNGISLDSPEFLAATAGTLLPDSDVFYQFFGDLPYLKYHRGFSHSLAGAVLLSASIAGILVLFFASAFVGLMGYACMGFFTHLALDWLNSYGVKLFWPFSQRMYAGSLLMVVDPFLIGFGLVSSLGFTLNHALLGWTFLWIMPVYICCRYVSRWHFARYLKRNFQAEKNIKLAVMPAFSSLFRWDFVMETDVCVYVGQAPIFRRAFQIKEKLSKMIEQEAAKLFVEKALESKLGRLFQEFTPHYFVRYERTPDNKHLVIFTDLRYYLGQRFLHQARVRYHEKGEIEESLFQPYHPDRKVLIDES